MAGLEIGRTGEGSGLVPIASDLWVISQPFVSQRLSQWGSDSPALVGWWLHFLFWELMECIWDQGSERILHYAMWYSTSSTGPPRPYIPQWNSFLFLRPLTWILSCRRGTNICVPSQSAAHLQSSAREPETPSAVYSTTSDTDALHGMFFLNNVSLSSLQGMVS